MGCAPSRPSASSPVSVPPDPGPPDLPLDIYSEVLGHLSPSLSEDRKTLRALALCCRALRGESQRILFRSLHRDANEIVMNPMGQARALDTHIKFLHAVEASPGRLARYVVSYAQRALGLDPALWGTERARNLAHKNRRVHLWILTERVLPLMVNLKNLYFSALVDHPSAPMIFRNCTFELESFTWVGIDGVEALYSRLLPTQHRLLHLNIDCTSDTLPHGLCPSLMSIACPLSELVRIAAGRAITALRVTESSAYSKPMPRAELMTTAERKAYIAALAKIRYLRLWALPEFQKSTMGITFHSVTMLEVRDWGSEILSDTWLLTSFPALRSLRLWENWSVLHAAYRRRVAAWAFPQFPMLEEVLLVIDRYVSTKVWRLLPPRGSELDEEMGEIDHNVALVWWRM
ncbi:hypothetical protein D9619_009503 [Psilocybe cf. subviscida]|uniref:Uncharacterized protein n=1 Tax=Psilocybe cf. subviscida TaxID=2480587 RepID=A0A8H5BUB4_9AGAR|nr:hypothetical protein D9619_009503 [Psilocybe cf. subviscida]